MSNGKQEQERLRRLQESQLADRDPNVKQRQFQRMSARRESRKKDRVTLRSIWGDISYAWKGFFLGLVLGTLILIVLPIFWVSQWAEICSAIAIVVLAIFGTMIGRAIDAREEIKRLAR